MNLVLLQDGQLTDDILTAHNDYREGFNSASGVTSANGIFPVANPPMQPLEWHNGLATMAQAHAEACVFSHSSPTDLQNKFDFSYIGENLYKTISSSYCACEDHINWSAAVKAWYDEIDFIPQSEICGLMSSFRSVKFNDEAIGHFTQHRREGFTSNRGFGVLISIDLLGNFLNSPVYDYTAPCPNVP
ncbi:CRISP/Allergen/PR-1 [Nymphon striatum]|nr:CRISP/Allergen/PR-1 [Nymphon striatum]